MEVNNKEKYTLFGNNMKKLPYTQNNYQNYNQNYQNYNNNQNYQNYNNNQNNQNYQNYNNNQNCLYDKDGDVIMTDASPYKDTSS